MLEPDGKKLERVMKRLEWERWELAYFADIHPDTLKNFLKKNRCSLRTIMKIARTLKINPSEIMKVR